MTSSIQRHGRDDDDSLNKIDEELHDEDYVMNEEEEEEDDEEEEAAVTPEGEVVLTRKQVGRPVSSIWSWFTLQINPQKMKSSSICRHCSVRINHHTNSEQAQRHLQLCQGFRYNVNGLEEEDCPDWYIGSKKRGAAPAASDSLGAAGGHDAVSVSKTPSTLSSTRSVSTRQIHTYMIPKLSQKTVEQFQMHMALHYYATGSSFLELSVFTSRQL